MCIIRLAIIIEITYVRFRFDLNIKQRNIARFIRTLTRGV